MECKYRWVFGLYVDKKRLLHCNRKTIMWCTEEVALRTKLSMLLLGTI